MTYADFCSGYFQRECGKGKSMILADKIIAERKKNGWSQEELAEKLNVSRQSVSKWEGAQSIPDLQKILKMSELFSVSTDYLLREEIEKAEYSTNDDEASPAVHKVSAEEANEYLEVTKDNGFRIAIATLICILSPITLFLLGGASDAGMLSFSEDAACGIGIAILLLFVAVAVAIFIFSGVRIEKFDYMEKEVFETEYGVLGIVRERKRQYEKSHSVSMVAAITICVVGVIPLFMIPIFGENDFFAAAMVSTLLLIEAIGVFILIRTAVIWSGFDLLLQEGDYSVKKKKDPVEGILTTVYWLIAVAAYLAWSFITNNWRLTWIIWPIAGVLCPAFIGIVRLIRNPKER